MNHNLLFTRAIPGTPASVYHKCLYLPGTPASVCDKHLYR